VRKGHAGRDEAITVIAHKEQEYELKKYIVITGGLVALAVPSAAMAAQPADPGYFGTYRADQITNPANADLLGGPGHSWWGEMASERAGDNGSINQDWREDYPQSMPQQ
jgi:hypothetical protein